MLFAVSGLDKCFFIVDLLLEAIIPFFHIVLFCFNVFKKKKKNVIIIITIFIYFFNSSSVSVQFFGETKITIVSTISIKSHSKNDIDDVTLPQTKVIIPY